MYDVRRGELERGWRRFWGDTRDIELYILKGADEEFVSRGERSEAYCQDKEGRDFIGFCSNDGHD
jgi:hypothetical protein